MPLWLRLELIGAGVTVLGGFLAYGADRGWFSSHYTYTVEGGEGFLLLGLAGLIGGLVTMVVGLFKLF